MHNFDTKMGVPSHYFYYLAIISTVKLSMFLCIMLSMLEPQYGHNSNTVFNHLHTMLLFDFPLEKTELEQYFVLRFLGTEHSSKGINRITKIGSNDIGSNKKRSIDKWSND